MMDTILKTIIGPIVVGVAFLAYDIDTILNSLLLSHSSQNLSKVYILLNLCTTRRSRLSESYRKMMFRKLPKSLK